jgi:hypothetical protein
MGATNNTKRKLAKYQKSVIRMVMPIYRNVPTMRNWVRHAHCLAALVIQRQPGNTHVWRQCKIQQMLSIKMESSIACNIRAGAYTAQVKLPAIVTKMGLTTVNHATQVTNPQRSQTQKVDKYKYVKLILASV